MPLPLLWDIYVQLTREQLRGWICQPPHNQKSTYNFTQPSVSTILHSQIKTTLDCVVLQYEFSERNPSINKHMQLKLVLFKGQLYFILPVSARLSSTAE